MASTVQVVAAAEAEPVDGGSVVLFYRYCALTSAEAAVLVHGLRTLCSALELRGRVLLASGEEGINGTLGGPDAAVKSYVAIACTTATDASAQAACLVELAPAYHVMAEAWWAAAACAPLVMAESDFKWSSYDGTVAPFADLYIREVPEIIGSGGVLKNIAISEAGQGYLTPTEFHAALQLPKRTLVIDCRNKRETAIGRFDVPGLIDPGTRSFGDFPRWVEENAAKVAAADQVLMYCTGGVRCEKASAFVRQVLARTGTSNPPPAAMSSAGNAGDETAAGAAVSSLSPSATSVVPPVYHLKGGIHRYLEAFSGEASLFRGKNFVFDQRGALGADSGVEPVGSCMGHCVLCSKLHDNFTGNSVCCVCREPVLVCPSCQAQAVDYHCNDHLDLKDCYFRKALPTFSAPALRQQADTLAARIQAVAVGKQHKNFRRTLHNQRRRVEQCLAALEAGRGPDPATTAMAQQCIHCAGMNCDGHCWGFLGVGRKLALEARTGSGASMEMPLSPAPPAKRQRVGSGQRPVRLARQHEEDAELAAFGWMAPASAFRPLGISSQVRCPGPQVRTLSTGVKGRWAGRPLLEVLKEQFFGVDMAAISAGLISLDGKPVVVSEHNTLLRQGSRVARMVHWHEAPVAIPSTSLHLQVVTLPAEWFAGAECKSNSAERELVVASKPASVPVHAAGPFMANTLTVLAEAELGLSPRSLLPCHRIDRATSGLVLLARSARVAAIVQTLMSQPSRVGKQYVARVRGEFPLSAVPVTSPFACQWLAAANCMEVTAPILTSDPAAGVRIASADGKPATSRFRRLSYDAEKNLSLVLAAPLTGRSHQLRVHLQLLGFPIHNDVLYGGQPDVSLEDSAVAALLAAASDASSSRELTAASTEAEGTSHDEATPALAGAAVAQCVFCQKGPRAAFDRAQLLGPGAFIDLHALRYRLAPVGSNATATLELTVPQPSWFGPDVPLSWLE